MTLDFINNYMNKKISENENKIIYTFYELKVKNNLSDEDLDIFLELNGIRFRNLGYKVYCANEKYIYNGEEMTVKENELMVAIKE